MKSLIIGNGEIGKGLYKALETVYPAIRMRGIEPLPEEKNGEIESYSVLHICFPYSKNFENEVEKYQDRYLPKYTIIHSTVPVGTSRKCNAFHSPIRGMHPHLANSIKTFVKYLGGLSEPIKEYFEKARIKIKMFDKPETTELLKILSTTYYAWNVVFCKEVLRICEDLGLDFDEVYTYPNNTYNNGYKKLDKRNVRRPVLKPTEGPIGGHCLMQNCELLEDIITKTIIEFNKRY